MGYNGLHGASLKMISSLKKYGLLEGRGEDVRLTKNAQVLIIDSPDSPDYKEAIRRSALNPEVYSEISKQFHTGGSERNIAVFLEKQGYNPDAAALVARNFKESMALVGENRGAYNDLADEQAADVTTMVAGTNASLGALNRSPRSITYSGGGGEFRGVAATAGVAGFDAPAIIGAAGAPFRIVLDGKQLQITASVDLKGLQTLKQVLEQYEAMLKMLDTGDDKPTP
jgi:hypothetical protein